MSQKDYVKFAKEMLGVEFKDVGYLIKAFTHRSYLNEHRKSVSEHNERMEFLGDAVLELVVTEYLHGNFKDPEGVLTNWRSALVRTESLSAAANKLGFRDYLRLSRGEKAGSERARQQIEANAFEAVIGAIYLDQGYEAVQKFITENIITTLDGILKSGSWRDAKSHLQEVAQSEEGATPSYRVIEEEGPDHDKIFTLGVYIDDELRGKGKGNSKQEAQQEAAQKALEHYRLLAK